MKNLVVLTLSMLSFCGSPSSSFSQFILDSINEINTLTTVVV